MNYEEIVGYPVVQIWPQEKDFSYLKSLRLGSPTMVLGIPSMPIINTKAKAVEVAKTELSTSTTKDPKLRHWAMVQQVALAVEEPQERERLLNFLKEALKGCEPVEGL